MPGERRLTSIKALLEAIAFSIGGTITVDEITNTVTVQLQEPVTIDGTINIGTVPTITVQLVEPITIDGTIGISTLPALTGTINIGTMPSLTIADIVNLNIDSIPSLTGSFTISHTVGNMTYTHGLVSVPAADTLIVPANANRKFLSLRRGTTVGRVFVKFGATAATVTNGDLFRENQLTIYEKEYIDTREVRGISVGSAKTIYWTEGV